MPYRIVLFRDKAVYADNNKETLQEYYQAYFRILSKLK